MMNYDAVEKVLYACMRVSYRYIFVAEFGIRCNMNMM